jgi:hypothetical protein
VFTCTIDASRFKVAVVFGVPISLAVCTLGKVLFYLGGSNFILHCMYSTLIFFIDTFVSLAVPSLQLRLTTSLFSNLDSKLKTNSQYLSIDQSRVLVLICSHILLRSCLAQIPLALCSAFNLDHYAH